MSTYNLEIPKDLMAVLYYYEDTCVMGCCGIDALDLAPQRAVDGMMDHGLKWAERGLVALDNLLPFVRSHVGPVESGQNDFGSHWKSSGETVLFLEQLHDSLSRAIVHVREHGFSDFPSS